VATQTIFFVNNSTPLTIHTNGSGAGNTAIIPTPIDGMYPALTYRYGTPTNSAYLEISHNYQIRAVLRGNTVFSNWTDGNGTVLTNGLTLKFTMSSNLVLNCNVYTNRLWREDWLVFTTACSRKRPAQP